jgi:hypothetical protein
VATERLPSKGKLFYDGQMFIMLETPDGPVIFAEIRGFGSELPMDANAEKIVELWNEAQEKQWQFS